MRIDYGPDYRVYFTRPATKSLFYWPVALKALRMPILKPTMALGVIARARGISQIARDTGLSHEILYRSLNGEHIPSFDTILKVTKALGIHLHSDPA